MENNEQLSKMDKLARDILTLSRNTLLVNLRYLDSALSQFTYLPYEGTLATEGRHILYDAKHVLKEYKDEKEASVRSYLHMVMHCIFRHMFMSLSVDRPCWDLACDIAVEYAISSLGLKAVSTKTESRQKAIFKELEEKIKILTAEKIYGYYQGKLSPAEMASLRGLFHADDHFLWYLTVEEIELITVKAVGQSKNKDENKNGNGKGDNDTEGNGEGEDSQSDSQSSSASQSLSDTWKDISEGIQTALETFGKEQGDKAGGLMQNLNAVNREKYDYTEFLKKFAVMGEAMKINDDEFDYIFYTYGMKMYEKMPLIEPLEYKEVKRIKEFIIALDTSGSVRGDLVQTFIQKTYNILKSTESFHSKINIHIVQCDAEVQKAVKITNQEEFDKYLETMTLHGFGGTDFRPVFEYVDKLIENKEFTNLKGLIYFTDGYGTFPEEMPDYETAFVFIDENYNNYDVPPWAIKLILQKDEI